MLLLALVAAAGVAVRRATEAGHSAARPAAQRSLADGVFRLRAHLAGDDEPVTDPRPARLAEAAAWAAHFGMARRAVALFGSRGGDTPPAPDPTSAGGAEGASVVRPLLLRPTVVLDAGDTLALASIAAPSTPAMSTRPAQWSTEGPVHVIGTHAVAEAPGMATLSSYGAPGPTRTPLLIRPAVRGRLYAVAPGGPDAVSSLVAGARVIVRRTGPGGTSTLDTVWSDAAGRFRLGFAPGTDAPADVCVEPAPSSSALPALLLRDVPAAQLHTLGLVLLPARWTIATGTLAGTVVPVHPALARGFWQFTTDHARPLGWLHATPLTVGFARGIADADTATFWRTAHALGVEWGRPLFAPAIGPAARAEDDAADDQAADVQVRATPTLPADGFTSIGWDASGAIAHASIDLRIRQPGTLQPGVVAHELMHALGFGHARGWLTVLAPAGHAMTAAPTPTDVAYAQLYDALRTQARRAEQTYGAAYGWSEALGNGAGATLASPTQHAATGLGACGKMM